MTDQEDNDLQLARKLQMKYNQGLSDSDSDDDTVIIIGDSLPKEEEPPNIPSETAVVEPQALQPQASTSSLSLANSQGITVSYLDLKLQ